MQDRNRPRAALERSIDEWALLLLLALCLVAPPTIADHIVPAGGTIVNNGLFDLACTDLFIGGVLDTGTGSYINVRSVTVTPSGDIQGSGAIRYSGALANNGTIQRSVSLIVNPSSNRACPGPGPAEAIPALGNSMIVALAMLLLWLGGSAARAQGMRLGRRESK